MRKTLLIFFITGILFGSISGVTLAGKVEVIPILGAVIGVPVALPRLLSCEDTSRRRTLRPISLRSFSAYGLDPTSRERYWIELGGRVGRLKEKDLLMDFRVYSISVFCGFRKAEFGFSAPYLRLDGDIQGVDYSEIGIGDSHFFGKRIFKRDKTLIYALGYRVAIPTGREENGLGTGELGFLPFASVGKTFKALALRSYTGYEFINESTASHPDSFLYGGGFSIRFAKNVAFRTDVNGTRVNSKNLLSVEPGMDFQFPTKNNSLIVRLNYAFGLTGDTNDYVIGGALVFAQR